MTRWRQEEHERQHFRSDFSKLCHLSAHCPSKIMAGSWARFPSSPLRPSQKSITSHYVRLKGLQWKQGPEKMNQRGVRKVWHLRNIFALSAQQLDLRTKTPGQPDMHVNGKANQICLWKTCNAMGENNLGPALPCLPFSHFAMATLACGEALGSLWTWEGWKRVFPPLPRLAKKRKLK